MFIGLCGGICAGKHEVASYLIQQHSFTLIRLDTPTPATTPLNIPTRYFPDKDNDTTEVDSSKVNELHFSNVDQVLEYVTPRWQEHFVTTQIWNEDILEALLRRPFFLLVSVDAPVTVRWKRYVNLHRSSASSTLSPSHDTASVNGQEQPQPITLESFVQKSDAHMYNPTTGLISLLSRASVRLLNPSSTLSILHQNLKHLDLVNNDRLRPSWDAYFMQLAHLAAQRSNCMKRRVGCVLIRERRVVSTGYNGSPRGMRNCGEGGCGRCNSGASGGAALSTCLCLHAEENALLEAGRDRIREGSILYCDTCPCLTCSIKIVQVGISEVVYSQGYSMDIETAAVLKEGGVKLRQFSPPRQGVVFLDGTEDDITSRSDAVLREVENDH